VNKLPSGTYYLIVKTDYTNFLYEGIETNNERAQSIVLKVPDLVVTVLTAPASVSTGQAISVSWTVQNQGSGDALGSWYDGLYLSTDAILDGSDTLISSQNQAGPIASGGSYTKTANWTVTKIPAGTYYFIVKTDYSNNYLYESNEANNERAQSFVIKVPDLVVTSLSFPVPVSPGQIVSVSWTVQNKGSGDALGSWYDRLYHSTDAILDSSDTLISSQNQAGPIASGGSYTKTANWTVPQQPVNYLIVKTDYGNTLYESNETNNERAKPVNDQDTDEDGVFDSIDNCPETPNGPTLGTCLPGSEHIGLTCTGDSDCGTNGNCSTSQEDSDVNGVGDVCDVPWKIRWLVRQYYLDILDREPDTSGLNYWAAEIEKIINLGIYVGEGFQALARFHFNSLEYLNMGKNDTEFLTDIYETFLQRPPDQTGLDSWLNQLNAGLTRNMVITQFANSPEFVLYMQNLFGPDTTRPENNLLNDFYRGILNVFPDQAGFNYYLGLMRIYQCNNDPAALRSLCHDIALSFVQSAQYQGYNRDNEGYVEDLYNGILRRGADASGFLYWVTILNNKKLTREEVLKEFTAGPEFQGRVQKVIDAGCLP
jgi:hypothetical protein